MANYNKSVNFAVKDTLTSGDPNKIVSGAEIDTEFSNIASSSTTKVDKVPAAVNNNLASFNASGSIQDSGSSASDFAPAAAGAPSGSVTAFAGQSAPSGWLECDGRAVSRTGNADLFAAIGTSFGNGDGSTTFNIPDLRGEFIRGWDNGRGVDTGRTFGSAQLDQMQQITGTLRGGSQSRNNGVFYSGTGSFSVSDSTGDGLADASGTGAFRQADFDSANSSGARTGSETRSRNVAMMYIIKT